MNDFMMVGKKKLEWLTAANAKWWHQNFILGQIIARIKILYVAFKKMIDLASLFQ